VIVGIRWISAFPAALVAAWIVVGVVERLGLMLGGVDPASVSGRFLVEAISGATMGVAFVYAGARVAPGDRDRACIVIAGAALLLVLAMLIPAATKPDLWAVWSGLCAAFGAVWVVLAAREGSVLSGR
jgi:hypothetical protein